MSVRVTIILALAMLTLPGCATQEGARHSQHTVDMGPAHTNELFTWAEDVLTPYIMETFQQHSWLRNRKFALVAMEGEDILPEINQVAEEIRTGLAQRLCRIPGLNMSWRPVQKPWSHHRNMYDITKQVECVDLDPIEVFVGIETRELMTGELQVSVNAVDIKQRQWVPNFGLDWRGQVPQTVMAALDKAHVDERLRGLRPLPFEDTEPDLVAAYLATNLSCLLSRGIQNYEEMVIFVDYDDSSPGVTSTAFELLDSYLNKMNGVRLTNSRQQATVIMERKVVDLRDGIMQLWVRSTFQDGSRLQGIETEVYVRSGQANFAIIEEQTNRFWGQVSFEQDSQGICPRYTGPAPERNRCLDVRKAPVGREPMLIRPSTTHNSTAIIRLEGRDRTVLLAPLW
jgi:hypothetical protein